MNGYDVIGDVHGNAHALDELLRALGYPEDPSTRAYRHAERQAIFVGDLVDRGSGQLRVLDTVKKMTDSGSAQIVMGNHEFNAIAYDTPHPRGDGTFLRERSEKNEKQHRAFLEQVPDGERAPYLDWFLTMPLWLDLGDIRVVHACWHQPSMDVVTAELGANRFSSRDEFVRATQRGDRLFEAIEILLKGPEVDLEAHGQEAYLDKGDHLRTHARVAWWKDDASTLRDLAVMDGVRTASGATYPALPDIEVPEAERSFSYRDSVPVFYGHYWREGAPEAGVDYTRRTACVDFSAGKGGKLMAYRWDGESEIRSDHYFCVGD